ncbi:glycosyltransferase family 4 protein [Methylosinus sp. PW1]|uniref:glycosyltransferase family 4 protein n=1 Tax=Methylosinus sp. PW1 TaxID=107636 RepID=UPI000559EEDC|nr:glycosyltransferase family 4 protein [Methylosinus sp. PW1]
MRILFFSHYFPPEVNAPASRTFEHCRLWAQAGHDVTVVTCAPNHPRGKIYPGYKNKLFDLEMLEGVQIARVWTFPAANEGFLLRILNYLSYMIFATLAVVRLERPDVIISTSPQLFCGLTGLLVKAIRGAPWVLEIRDLWPESIVTVGAMRKGGAIRFLEWLGSLAYRSADHIVSVTDSFVMHIAARGGAGKIDVIKNGADLEFFKLGAGNKQFKEKLGFEGRFVAAYVGTHGMAHALETVLDAAERLSNDRRIGFLMVGDGAERARLLARAETMKLENLRIVGQLPKTDMPTVWAATDVSLILLKHSDLFKSVVPSKMFEAMAMGRPIVLGVKGEACAMLEEAGAGIAITPESAEELAAAVVKLADDPELAARLGRQGSDYVREHYDRTKLARNYLDLLESVIAKSRIRKQEAGSIEDAASR